MCAVFGVSWRFCISRFQPVRCCLHHVHALLALPMHEIDSPQVSLQSVAQKTSGSHFSLCSIIQHRQQNLKRTTTTTHTHTLTHVTTSKWLIYDVRPRQTPKTRMSRDAGAMLSVRWMLMALQIAMGWSPHHQMLTASLLSVTSKNRG